jgi:glutaredoxin-like protein NrdH
VGSSPTEGTTKSQYNKLFNYKKGDNMTVVYTKPQCIQCDMTKRLMDKIGVEYTTVDIVENPAELDKLIEMGYRAAPVVVTEDDSWAGFQPDKISELAA